MAEWLNGFLSYFCFRFQSDVNGTATFDPRYNRRELIPAFDVALFQVSNFFSTLFAARKTVRKNEKKSRILQSAFRGSKGRSEK